MCTRDELANGCAAFTGCSFDDSYAGSDTAAVYAWTSTAASSETCASYESCGEFVTAFDKLYDASPNNNPMRDDSDVAVGEDFNNARFPTDVAFEIDDSSGVATFQSYLYERDSSLSTDPAVKFCGAKYGPPLELTKACDASIDVLLGPEISIGLLSSTAKALEGKNSIAIAFKLVKFPCAHTVLCQTLVVSTLLLPIVGRNGMSSCKTATSLV